MKRKERQARRIRSLFQHLHQIEAGRLSRLEAAASQLSEDERRLVSYLDGDGVLPSLFPDIVLNRLRSTARQHKAAELAIEGQAEVALAQARRAKQGEKLLAGIKREQDFEILQRELQEIIDNAFRSADKSSP